MISKLDFINWVVGTPNNHVLVLDTFGQLGYMPIDVNFKEDYRLICTNVEYYIQFYDKSINQQLPSSGYVPKLAETYYTKYFPFSEELKMKTIELTDEENAQLFELVENELFYLIDDGNIEPDTLSPQDKVKFNLLVSLQRKLK